MPITLILIASIMIDRRKLTEPMPQKKLLKMRN